MDLIILKELVVLALVVCLRLVVLFCYAWVANVVRGFVSCVTLLALFYHDAIVDCATTHFRYFSYCALVFIYVNDVLVYIHTPIYS